MASFLSIHSRPGGSGLLRVHSRGAGLPAPPGPLVLPQGPEAAGLCPSIRETTQGGWTQPPLSFPGECWGFQASRHSQDTAVPPSAHCSSGLMTHKALAEPLPGCLLCPKCPGTCLPLCLCLCCSLLLENLSLHILSYSNCTDPLRHRLRLAFSRFPPSLLKMIVSFHPWLNQHLYPNHSLPPTPVCPS